MSVALLVALFLCPAGGVVDRVEDDAVVVWNSTGVRVIAARDLEPRGRRVREGDRIEPTHAGGCRAVPPSPADVRRVLERLRRLETARSMAPKKGDGAAREEGDDGDEDGDGDEGGGDDGEGDGNRDERTERIAGRRRR